MHVRETAAIIVPLLVLLTAFINYKLGRYHRPAAKLRNVFRAADVEIADALVSTPTVPVPGSGTRSSVASKKGVTAKVPPLTELQHMAPGAISQLPDNRSAKEFSTSAHKRITSVGNATTTREERAPTSGEQKHLAADRNVSPTEKLRNKSESVLQVPPAQTVPQQQKPATSQGAPPKHGPRLNFKTSLQQNYTSPGDKWSKLLRENTKMQLQESKLYYLHIPKAGTSFETAITAAVCPELHRVANASEYLFGLGSQFISENMQKMPAARVCAEKFEMFADSFHHNAYRRRANGKRNVVTMVRDPYERIVSGYFDRFHSCTTMQVASGMRFRRPECEEGDWNCNQWTAEEWKSFVLEHFDKPTDMFSILAYAKCVAGCQTNMLIGRGCEKGAPNKRMIQDAVQVFNSDVVFAGITERFQETIRLWSALWSSTPRGTEFMSAPPPMQHTQNRSSEAISSLDTSHDAQRFEAFHVRHSKADDGLRQRLRDVLRSSGFKDAADEVLHTKVVNRFEALWEATAP